MNTKILTLHPFPLSNPLTSGRGYTLHGLRFGRLGSYKREITRTISWHPVRIRQYLEAVLRIATVKFKVYPMADNEEPIQEEQEAEFKLDDCDISSYEGSSSEDSDQSSLTESDTEGFQVLSVLNAGSQPTKCAEQQEEGAMEAGVDKEKRNEQQDSIGGEHLCRWFQEMIKNNTKESQGDSFLDNVQKNKNFHNPAIFQKMVTHCGIQPLGTNFEHVVPLSKHEYYEEITDLQDLCMSSDL